MILEGANRLKEENDYIIYAINSATAGQYCATVPKSWAGTLNMLVDLHQKKLFDEVTSGQRTKDDLINELTEEYQKSKVKYSDILLIVPMMEEESFASAVTNLDKQKMFDETKKIGAITSELYNKIIASGVDKQKIDQKIIMIEKKPEDEKYVEWLKKQMPGFVEGVSLETEQVVTNKEVTSENIFDVAKEEINSTQETPTTQESINAQTIPTNSTPTSGGIFDNIPSPVTSQENSPIPEAPVSTSVMPSIEQPIKTEELPKENVDIFGISLEQPTIATPNIQEPNPIINKELSKEEPIQTVEEPKAVQDIALEGTTSFSPIPNIPQPTVENTSVTEEPQKKSGGFVNLAILLVVLVVVTIISVELGKYLYSVYGA